MLLLFTLATLVLGEPNTCQPRSTQPFMPIYHLIGNVSTDANGVVTNVESINDISSIFKNKSPDGLYHIFHQCCQVTPSTPPLPHHLTGAQCIYWPYDLTFFFLAYSFPPSNAEPLGPRRVKGFDSLDTPSTSDRTKHESNRCPPEELVWRAWLLVRNRYIDIYSSFIVRLFFFFFFFFLIHSIFRAVHQIATDTEGVSSSMIPYMSWQDCKCNVIFRREPLCVGHGVCVRARVHVGTARSRSQTLGTALQNLS